MPWPPRAPALRVGTATRRRMHRRPQCCREEEEEESVVPAPLGRAALLGAAGSEHLGSTPGSPPRAVEPSRGAGAPAALASPGTPASL